MQADRLDHRVGPGRVLPVGDHEVTCRHPDDQRLRVAHMVGVPSDGQGLNGCSQSVHRGSIGAIVRLPPVAASYFSSSTTSNCFASSTCTCGASLNSVTLPFTRTVFPANVSNVAPSNLPVIAAGFTTTVKFAFAR